MSTIALLIELNARPCCVNCLNVLRKCIPFNIESEMCVMKETNVGGRSKPLGWNIWNHVVMVECDMDEVCEQGPGQSTWFPHFGYFFFAKSTDCRWASLVSTISFQTIIP